MKQPIVKYISLKYIYQMNPPQFISDMLKRIEKRNQIQIKKNPSGVDVALYGIAAGENDMIERFKSGNLNQRSYGTKNEEFERRIIEGLNLPKKHAPLKNIPKKNNSDVVSHFFDRIVNPKISKWGIGNIKIIKHQTGWALTNYKTMLAWRTFGDNFYINSNRYSQSTDRVQHNIRYTAQQKASPERVKFVTEKELYDIAGITNETVDYPYIDKNIHEMVDDVITINMVKEGLNLVKKDKSKYNDETLKAMDLIEQIFNRFPNMRHEWITTESNHLIAKLEHTRRNQFTIINWSPKHFRLKQIIMANGEEIYRSNASYTYVYNLSSDFKYSLNRYPMADMINYINIFEQDEDINEGKYKNKIKKTLKTL